MVQQDLYDNPNDAGYTGPTHYYASNYLGWATGATRAEALINLAASFRREMSASLKTQLRHGDPGVYAWSCRVLADAEASYPIKNYAPQDVEIDSVTHVYFTHITRRRTAYHTTSTTQHEAQAHDHN